MTDEPKLTDVLAQQRTELAAERTLMAADRSLMAWVRTGLALIGFGFTIYAFLLSMAEKSKTAIISMQQSRRIGLFLLALGIISIVLGCLQDWATINNIKKIHKVSPWRFPLVIAGFIGLLGIFLFISIFVKIRLF